MGAIELRFLTQSPGWQWSYSRLRQFESCKYGWLLKYVIEEPKRRLFFSEYGKLIHELIANVLSEKMVWSEAADRYIQSFYCIAHCDRVAERTKTAYFSDGLRYFLAQSATANNPMNQLVPLRVEPRVDFMIDGHSFCGYIDLIGRDMNGKVFVVDHKSRALKERGGRRAKSNAVLDEYLTQLYLYSIPITEMFGRPEGLMFNCFRTNTVIAEVFSEAKLVDAVRWATSTIEEILEEKDWTCNWRRGKKPCLAARPHTSK